MNLKNNTAATLAFLCIFLFCTPLHADPDNVLVGSLTFVRPPGWIWATLPNSAVAVTRYVIPKGSEPYKTDVRFYHLKRDAALEKQILLDQFPTSKPGDLHEEEVRIGDQKIIYYKIFGTYKHGDAKPKPNQLFVGAVIPETDQYVYARLQGPRDEAIGELETFKKMVENAVKEHEGN